jgi:hypothetical protein
VVAELLCVDLPACDVSQAVWPIAARCRVPPEYESSTPRPRAFSPPRDRLHVQLLPIGVKVESLALFSQAAARPLWQSVACAQAHRLALLWLAASLGLHASCARFHAVQSGPGP